ncbi:MAG: G8 domain-containing protein [Candidatus Korobacteraceae bacterium]
MALWLMTLLTGSLRAATRNGESKPGSIMCSNGESLPAGGDGSQDVQVIGPGTCFVYTGTYMYHNINVYSGGLLQFVDNGNTDLWAESILVENSSSLIAGSAATPYGQTGTLTIHLWGAAQPVGTGKGDGGAGITCLSDQVNQCGVPNSIWSSNPAMGLNPPSCVQSQLPGGVTDCFYGYMPLDYDDGASGDPPKVGYFGYKVLGVSYGGTLQLFGKKGATYSTLPLSNSGTSWARLAASVSTGATALTLDRVVDWVANDNIVLTTTDYLPAHSEQLIVGSNDTSQGYSVITLMQGQTIQYAHNGTTFDLGAENVPSGIGPNQDPNIKCSGTQTRCVETRAAVGLLTRSIRIVSAGDTAGANFPAPVAGCGPGNPCYYFGGHTIVRQGFAAFQVQGVEFYQMGEGGRIMHYPVHFHMTRQTPRPAKATDPPVTFVKDSSVWDSMSRWYTLHASQGVTLARNVGYLSIGHGYYLENGSETNNQLFANLGVLARGGILNNPQNPRNVPGILSAAHINSADDEVPFHTDTDHPTVFWMMNGWNDFEYNMAAGTGACGMCYWLLPSMNSGMSRYEYWNSYAGEQQYLRSTGGIDNPAQAGITPLKSFVGNSCSSSQNSFMTVGNTAECDITTTLTPIVNPLAPAFPSDPTSQAFSAAADAYYPKVIQGGAHAATLCPEAGFCGNVLPCAYNDPSNGSLDNCAITDIDHYTSSFHWAQLNVAAIWLRKQWYLLTNSALTDVQSGGLTFVSGGGYTGSDEVPGYWALAHKNVFIGMTQASNPFASNAGPFNPNSGITCDPGAPAAFCPSLGQGITIPLDSFAVNQRMFSLYDGPSYQSANAYLEITPTTLSGCPSGANCSSWMYWRTNGVPLDPTQDSGSQCYLPNAAIAWKQPNGFYYPPAFHSDTLYFNNVDIRHFVVEPLFLPSTFQTDPNQVKVRYCVQASDMFTGFTDIDRQTELSDDDGSLTGLIGPLNKQSNSNFPSISVNKDAFFNVPVETAECESDTATLMPQGTSCPYNQAGYPQLCATANTSPYDYVTTVLFPGCGVTGTCGNSWGSDCTGNSCYGVPLYREQTNPGETGPSEIRMMAQATYQRSNLTANNARYYIDTTVSDAIQAPWCADNNGGASCPTSENVFQSNGQYYVFLLFAKPTTKQIYQLYVGTDFDTSTLLEVRADQEANPPVFTPGDPLPCVKGKGRCFDPSTGILTVSLDMSKFSDFQSNYEAAKQDHCAPASFCSWNSSTNTCGCNSKQRLSSPTECQNACANWAGKDINCPEGGCYGFTFTLPGDFVAGSPAVPPPDVSCFPKTLLGTAHPSPWNIQFTSGQNPGNCAYTSIPTGSFCSNLTDSLSGSGPGSAEEQTDR